ncbi:hypothetical protein IEO21_08881 [Rhodonia placenta]|uniref:Uncharacterized protein n=1 Tax=Rhodonia placenta TaxID=104341 RepID=A0A8H7TYY8_9APHY|nr:hypothetical protein IEO21_08881 [Postia placenta]
MYLSESLPNQTRDTEGVYPIYKMLLLQNVPIDSNKLQVWGWKHLYAYFNDAGSEDPLVSTRTPPNQTQVSALRVHHTPRAGRERGLAGRAGRCMSES